jgi:hypothetical protein
VTAFVITVGDEPNVSHCKEALAGQVAQPRIELIDHVAPMSAAFQQQLDRCRTPYFVQVDEDMILDPDAVAVLHEQLHQYRSASCAMLCGGLWDVDADRPLYGVKIFRHEIARRYPFRDSLSCEMDQSERWRADGYWSEALKLGSRGWCLGLHGAGYNPRTAFVRWERLWLKQRRFGWMKWIERLARPHLERWRRTGDPMHLACVLGMVAGMVGPHPPERELDFREGSASWRRVCDAFFGGAADHVAARYRETGSEAELAALVAAVEVEIGRGPDALSAPAIRLLFLSGSDWPDWRHEGDHVAEETT